ncbi:alpha/beta fold hydrolase [Aquibium microcysteis]|uniref:alpha/beta fold hydrolase n=1 Tax=Aquibium microcysteis TaxID=675281 RepID=UPI00165D0A5C|nr:alpha/beta hydrolase [Aquibium microcysteis]
MSPSLRNLFMIALVAVVVTAIGFRILASSRESYGPETVAGPGATFADVQGLRIHYEEWGPKDGRPVLFLSGAMGWSGTWRALAEPLAAAGYRVIAPDLPPFGMSDRPSAALYTRARQAALVAAFADAMRLERFSLVGHSFGAGATVETAFANAARIERLVLIGGAIEPGRATGGSLGRMLLGMEFLRPLAVSSTFTNPLAINIGLKSLVHDPSVVTKDLSDLYGLPLFMRGTTQAIGDWLMTGFYADESQSLSADPDNYRSFIQSVLLVWGKEDGVVPVAVGETLLRLFPAARLEVLEGVSHLPHVEKPQHVAGLIANFLGGRNGPGPAAAPPARRPLPLVSAAGLRGTVESAR